MRLASPSAASATESRYRHTFTPETQTAVSFVDGDGFDTGLLVAALSGPHALFPSRQWLEGICGMREAGTERVNGFECTKIEVATRDSELVVVYLAKQ